MPTFVTEHAVIVIGILLVAGGLLHLSAWKHLDEFNWVDIIMREGPPFEDLSPTGQLLAIASWLCAAAGVVIIVWVYVLPELRATLG
jgi:hypothetical protein